MAKRKTRQQMILIETLAKIDSFFSAEEMQKKVDKSEISLATIYRFLNKLEEENEIFSYICDRKKIYSKEDKSHCHFICEETGKIIHFSIGNIDFIKDKIPGRIRSFQLEVRGVCEKCSTQKKDS